jgi:serine/threonine-protein kinase RsbW
MNGIQIQTDGAKTTLLLGSHLTATQVPELRVALRNAIDAGARALTVDLAAVAVMDSMGIGLLIATGNSLARLQGAITLINASPDIMGLLRNMRLIDRLKVSAAPTE